jgi:subtilisin family serine protease/subtilisin-like proprotein convertase family protein
MFSKLYRGLNIFFFIVVMLFEQQTAISQVQINQLGKKTPAITDNNRRLIVVYKANSSANERNVAINGVASKGNKPLVEYSNLAKGNIAVVELQPGVSLKQAQEKLASDKAVEFVERDSIVQAFDRPNDPYFNDLWGLNNSNDKDIDAVEAWDTNKGNREVIVGVIDTGIDYTHRDLIDNLWTNPREIPDDQIDNDRNGYVDDVHGINAIVNNGDPLDYNNHGSHIAGTIGAVGNNNRGVVGVNQIVSLAACKFLNDEGWGYTSNALKCFNYFIGLKRAGYNVKVLNNSWGGYFFSSALYNALKSVESAGILMVSAAGNDGQDTDPYPVYPAGYEIDSVVSVTATDSNDALPWYANYGNFSVDLAAPGDNILSTYANRSYGRMSGTSMATAYASGAAALFASQFPSMSSQGLKELLMNTGDIYYDLQSATNSGKRLNVGNAFKPAFYLSASLNRLSVNQGSSAQFNFQIDRSPTWRGGAVDLSLVSPVSGARLSTNRVSSLPASFNLTVDTRGLASGEYQFKVTATDGINTKENYIKLFVWPTNLTTISYSNEESMPIPDWQIVSSRIAVADNITIKRAELTLDVSHGYISDLDINLVSPTGQYIPIHQFAGGSNDDIKRTYRLDSLEFYKSAGDWRLDIGDFNTGDVGTLNKWSLKFYGTGQRTTIDLSQQRFGSYGGSEQDVNSLALVTSDGRQVDLVGNGWKSFSFPYSITPNTVMEFDFSSASAGEIQGIGFDSDTMLSGFRHFQLFGSDTWGIQNFADIYRNYTKTWHHFAIPVGYYYARNLGRTNYMFFSNDHDVAYPNAQSSYRNIQVYERRSRIDFRNMPIASYDPLMQDYPGGGKATEEDGGRTLTLQGNTWKKISFPYHFTNRSVLEFDFYSDDEGDVHGIGFDNDVSYDNGAVLFQVFGTQKVGEQLYHDYHTRQGRWIHYAIPLGGFLNGDYSNMFFVNDRDYGIKKHISKFRNVIVSER